MSVRKSEIEERGRSDFFEGKMWAWDENEKVIDAR